ncbi:suppressor of ftsI/bilirubin oxidase [Nitrosomonas eutropha]|uniref:multicopper oxidase family protein n=1 Tax=Nitrosomonas TaxID=914 RepID=UPI000888E8D3|nr:MULTISPECIES: multicopper oxidase domain-containing protein [Nitrosomonas]MXS81084.1 multicopper oxidase family protein [Nitrosomonas sp. GH22]SCX29050.1 suppressor of ftsI/bilirubin oxidase [Nitrosomonas eutropha]
MTNTNLNRRRFLQYAASGTLAAAIPGFAFTESNKLNKTPNSAFKADVEIALTAQMTEVSILPGANTRVLKYTGKLLKGPSGTLKELPSYLGPVLNFEQGQKVRIFFYNQIPEPCVTHWHGMHVPQIMDGHPMYAINQGEQYVYEFEVKNPAGTNWYHSHTHEVTARQVYQGLAGLITITDEIERKLDLPSDEYDIPLIIQDRTFTSGNQLYYALNMHQRMQGFLGDTILANGRRNHVIPVKTRAYRLRILNGSNSRIYKLGWSDGSPLTIIGTDGGLLEKPQTFPYIMLAPAERVELWVDFSGRKPGSELALQTLSYQGFSMRMGGGMGMGSNTMDQGNKGTIVKFAITKQVSDSPRLPDTLVPIHRFTAKDTSNPDIVVPIAIGMRRMTFNLNGRTFDMLDYTNQEKIPVNTVQRIRISNINPGIGGDGGMGGGMRGGRGGGMMGMIMAQPHPIHLHGQQFQILSRKPGHAGSAYAAIKDGFINSGWKDTVLVMPGEEVEIIKPFTDYTGLFLYHCHNLEHEDMGMMRNFFVS